MLRMMLMVTPSPTTTRTPSVLRVFPARERRGPAVQRTVLPARSVRLRARLASQQELLTLTSSSGRREPPTLLHRPTHYPALSWLCLLYEPTLDNNGVGVKFAGGQAGSVIRH